MSTRLFDELSNTIHVLPGKSIIGPLRRQKLRFEATCLSSDKLASSELSELLRRSSNEPEMLPNPTRKHLLWQRLEWAARCRRQHQQACLWLESPEQLEFEFDI